jgi:NCAIR mutase (PurE)-related protein
METREILEKVKSGDIPIEQAEHYFRQKPFDDIGFAKLDTHRKIRTGFGEVVFCSGKSDLHLRKIMERLAREEGNVLGTRASKAQYELIRELCPDAKYDELAHLVKVILKPVEKQGMIAVCTAGTADIPVAEEAAQTAEFFGGRVNRIYDVGVSGLHRLLANLDSIQEANCIIAVAGMEGALPSVLGGLVSNPVIAVPTSIGYGASFQGVAALLTMLNSCANGIAVVNIDNGFGAGYMATQINRLACRKNSACGSYHE